MRSEKIKMRNVREDALKSTQEKTNKYNANVVGEGLVPAQNNHAITLISLVITIIILLILAGVTINLTIGENGLFGIAKEAREETNKQVATEKMNLKITTAQIEKYAEKQEILTLKELSEVLKDDSEIEYVTEVSQLASAKYEVGENPSKIFTKLKEYPYEFQINSSLQLVSIDGTKLPENSTVTGAIGESNIIEDIELLVSFNNGEYLELTCNVKTLNNDSVAGYAFLLNDEVKIFCTENIVNIDGLTLDTNYTVSVIVMDRTGKIKRTNNIEVKTENKVYLYKEGNECKYITNGWGKTGYHYNDKGTVTKNDNNIHLYAPYSSRIFCGTSKKIDLSKYSGLYIENEGSQYLCQITTTAYYNNGGSTDIYYNSKEKLDISSYNSQYYLHMTVANDANATIKNIWLEY